MTPTIALIAVSLIAAGLCVAVGIMQWRINQLKAENDRERARHEVTNELLTEARNEAKVENDLRRQAEKNLAVANNRNEKQIACTDQWYGNYLNEQKRALTLEYELSKYSRKRDPKTGRFYSAKKVIADAFNGHDVIKRGEDVNEVKVFAVNRDGKACDVYVNGKPVDSGKTATPKPHTLIETDGLTARIVPKPHTLRHGMTVKDPTPEQAKEIFDEANRLGIDTACEELSDSNPWIWFTLDRHISTCSPSPQTYDIYVTPSQFLSHMRGEDVETLCEEVKANAASGI